MNNERSTKENLKYYLIATVGFSIIGFISIYRHRLKTLNRLNNYNRELVNRNKII